MLENIVAIFGIILIYSILGYITLFLITILFKDVDVFLEDKQLLIFVYLYKILAIILMPLVYIFSKEFKKLINDYIKEVKETL